MRIGRVRVGSEWDFAAQNVGGPWVTFSSMGIAAVDTPQVIASSRLVRAMLESGRGMAVAGEVELLRPVLRPSKMLAIGLNYMDHIRETRASVPERPVVFAKYPNSLNDPFGKIVIDSDLTSKGDYEAELAVLIGRTASRVKEAEALSYVYGYCVANDVSARDLQVLDTQFSRSKSFDTFCPIGPWITTSDEIRDPQDLLIESHVNGESRQASTTREMIFSVAQLISYLSSTMTLEPGDVVLTGTPHGVGFAMNPPVFLQPGDRVSCEIAQLGRIESLVESPSTLNQPIVR